ncbi:suppressor of fused domain protein [Pseudomonas sp. PS02290]|uniref:suppressor of fused domain protein n=1 Tax=Pseudomonas sp. PS02290 TaxID=2991430 RepID=UPI00249B6D22|nr:suppressor of fused domain protein [Pseudomonas sp. PS02290]
MSTPSDQSRAIAKRTLQVLKGELKVQVYYDDNRALSVEFLTTLDPVHKGVKSIGSIGLSEISLLDADGDEFGTRVELGAAALTPEIYWENAVASAAFFIQKRKEAVMPGDVVPNIFQDYLPDPIMPRIYLTVPCIWNDSHFPELSFKNLKINWLQCVAIYEVERVFIEKFGGYAFDDLLSEQGINTLNTQRPLVRFD